MDILTVLSRADELYSRRARQGSVKESVAMLAGTRGGWERYEVQWRLARALFFLGQESDSKGARQQLHAAAIGAGARAVELSPGRVEGLFWLGVNLALFAEAQGGIKGARAILRARHNLKRAAAMFEAYHDAGPLRVLGRLEHKAPWFLGGSRKRSRKYFERALSIAPNNSVTLLYATELALDMDERDKAVRMLDTLMELPTESEWEFENRRDRAMAQKLLEGLRQTHWTKPGI